MTIKDTLKKYSSIEIELLLSHILGKPKEFLYINPAHELTQKQADKLALMATRRMAGEPMAYILGYKDFYGFRFKVNKDVLIPRPETEWVIERLKDLKFKDWAHPVSILDIGTGSGAIAISLAKNFSILNSQFSIYASDISPSALKVAKTNAKTHKVKVNFINSDLFKKITGKFDVVIANLPYVQIEYIKKLPKKITATLGTDDVRGLLYEPKIALTDGTNEYRVYERFFHQVGKHLNHNGIIYLEIDPEARKFFKKYQKKYLPGKKMKFFKDFDNFWRYAEIK